ncbi:hypothetical protein B484DRAFT_406884 [Ochromonadaceae sp. CCMP2298]|nr:hypothetical protein B484DRAFT_406884 [Ochromonadaceae sp. CCMP2298]
MWGKDLASLSWRTAAHLQANHMYLLKGMLASAGPDICFLELQRSVQESRYRDFRQAGGVASTEQGAEARGHSGVYNPDLPQWGGTQWGVMGPDQDSDFEDQLTAFDGTLRDDSEDSGGGPPIPAGRVEELDILATEIRSGEDPYEESVRLLRQRAAEALRLAEAALNMEQLQAEQSTLQEQYVDSNTPSSYDGEEHENYYSSAGSDDNESLYTCRQYLRDTPDRFFRLPNAVEAEFMANNPEKVELMWQEDIVQLPPASALDRERYSYFRYEYGLMTGETRRAGAGAAQQPPLPAAVSTSVWHVSGLQLVALWLPNFHAAIHPTERNN